MRLQCACCQQNNRFATEVKNERDRTTGTVPILYYIETMI